MDVATTFFIGSQMTKYYYFFGASRIATCARQGMRKYAIPQSMTVEYLLTDHIGSTTLTTDSAGVKVSEMRYNKPFGEVRYAWTNAQATPANYTLMKYTFCAAPLAGTGQYSYLDNPSTPASEGFGLMFYVSRWYDPSLGRFAQADTIVPTSTQGTQAWDRYAYVNNNPVRYTDPSGHYRVEEPGSRHGCSDPICKPAQNLSNFFLSGNRILRQGIIYDQAWTWLNADLRKLQLSYKAEQGYTGYGGSGASDTPVGVAVDLFSAIVDAGDFLPEAVNNIPKQVVETQLAWSETETGTWIDSFTIMNESSTVVQLTRMYLGEKSIKPDSADIFANQSDTIFINSGIDIHSQVVILIGFGCGFSASKITYTAAQIFLHSGCQSFR